MKVMLPKAKSTSEARFIKSPIKLTISLLVSNRIETIRKCMDSLKIILDAIPSELIAVDTVGEENSDGSLDVVKEYTDQIVHFDWIGDFAAARNAGLELAKGEWFLYVDDDEWFEDPEEIIEFFQSGECMQYGCTQYVIRSYTDETLTHYSQSWASRLMRLTAESRFIHPVHEMIAPVYQPEKKFNRCYAHHVGYIFKNQEDRKKHFERNIGPILEELERHPDNLRLVMQAIQEYQFDGNFEKAEELCRMGEKNKHPGYDLVWNWVVAELVETLSFAKKHKEALEEGQRILELPRVNQLARMNIDYCLVSVAQELKDTERVIQYAKDYQKMEQYFDKDPDRALSQVMLTLGDILREEKRGNIHNCLFSTYKEAGKYEELCEYSDRIAWDKEYMKQLLLYLFLMEAATNSEHYDSLTRATQKICNQGEFPSDWLEEIQKICQGTNKENKYKLCKAFAQVDTDEEYFLILKAWCAEQDGEDVVQALQECQNRGMDCALPREELLGICLRTGNDPSPFLKSLYWEDWVASCTQLVIHTDQEDLQGLLDCVQRNLSSTHPIQSVLLSKLIHQRLLHDPQFPEEKLWDTIAGYAKDLVGYYRYLYRQERFESEMEANLPREAVFAVRLEEAVRARKQEDLEGTLAALTECVRAYPPRKELVTRLISNINKDLQEQQQQQEEFRTLGEQIKKQIYQLIALGQTVQAQQILEKLRALTPNDQELDVIAQRI